MAKFNVTSKYDSPVTVGSRELGVSFKARNSPATKVDLTNDQKAYLDANTKPYLNLAADNTVFTSNAAPTLTGGNVYNLTVTINGGAALSPVLTGADLAALVTAATGNATYNVNGTFAVVGQTITLSSNTATSATLVIGQQAP